MDLPPGPPPSPNPQPASTSLPVPTAPAPVPPANATAKAAATAKAPQPAPTGGSGANADDRSTTFRPVEGGGEMQSGEKLLVEAYAAIWIILFALVMLSWRRQRRIDERIANLETEVAKARDAEAAKGGG